MATLSTPEREFDPLIRAAVRACGGSEARFPSALATALAAKVSGAMRGCPVDVDAVETHLARVATAKSACRTGEARAPDLACVLQGAEMLVRQDIILAEDQE